MGRLPRSIRTGGFRQACVSRQDARPALRASSAVLNYNRVAAALVRICRALLAVGCTHFFDGFFAPEPEGTTESAFQCFLRLGELCGFTCKEAKQLSDTTAPKGPLLGLWVELQSSANAFCIGITPDRRAALTRHIDVILQRGTISCSAAGSMAGRLSFASSGLLGRCGRAFLRPLYRRQHHAGPALAEDEPLLSALKWRRRALEEFPERQIPRTMNVHRL